MKRGIPMAIAGAFLWGALHTACTPPPDPTRMRSLDSLLTMTDSLQAVVNGIDVDVYRRMDSVFRAQRDGIEARFNDTLVKGSAMILGNYHRAMNKSLGRVLKHRPTLQVELATSRKQLTDLRHDLDRGLLPDGPQHTYLQQETMILGELARNVTALERSAGTASRAWLQRAAVDSLLAIPRDPAGTP